MKCIEQCQNHSKLAMFSEMAVNGRERLVLLINESTRMQTMTANSTEMLIESSA